MKKENINDLKIIDKNIRRRNDIINIKQIKFLEDEIWGKEFGKWTWVEPLSFYEELNNNFPDSIITVSIKEKNIHNELIDRVIGLAIIAPIDPTYVKNLQDFIDNERMLDSLEYWTTGETNIYELFHLLIDKEYRDSDCINDLLKGVEDYFSNKDNYLLCATAVSSDGRKLLDKIGTKVAIKEEERGIYTISIDSIKKKAN